MRKALTNQTIEHNIQNNAQGTNVTNSKKKTNTKQCARQKVNRTHKNQCATPERNKLSTEHIQNIVWGTNVMNTPTENIQNSAQNTNVTKNHKEHSQNSAPDTNERNNQTEHIQKRGRGTNVTNCQQNT